MKEHTALPWRIGDAGTTVFGPPNGNPSPVTVTHTSRENAAYIAKACNAYPELIKALEEVKVWLVVPDFSPEVVAGMRESVKQTLAALKGA